MIILFERLIAGQDRRPKMSKQQRWRQIIEICREQDAVNVEQLVEALGVSPATVRRDLQEMDDLNIISRFHGGARINVNQFDEPHMLIKGETYTYEKRAIARRAARLIHDHQLVYLDAGSTTLEMLQYITAKNITVVSPGLPHLTALAQKEISTIVPGGPLRSGTAAIAGMATIKQIEQMYFDIAFVGTNGIHESVGFTTTNEMEGGTKAAAVHRAENAYILADSSKFGILNPVKFASLDEAVVITDSIPDSFDSSLIRYIKSSGETNF